MILAEVILVLYKVKLQEQSRMQIRCLHSSVFYPFCRHLQGTLSGPVLVTGYMEMDLLWPCLQGAYSPGQYTDPSLQSHLHVIPGRICALASLTLPQPYGMALL